MKLKILALILFLFSYSILFSQSTWTGNGDGVSFDDSQNWNPQSIPMINTTITFNTGTEITVTNIPNNFTNATPLTEIRILSNTTVFFDNSTFGSVEIYMTNLNIEENSGLILTGTDTISIETENADISGTIDAGDRHKFETYNSGTIEYNNLANLITANTGGFESSFQGGFGFPSTDPYSIKFNGSAYQSTGLINNTFSFDKIIIENSDSVYMDNDIQTDTLELNEGIFKIEDKTLTVNQYIKYENENSLLSANGASSLTFGDGSGSGGEYILIFDINNNTLYSLTINKANNSVTTLESDLVISSSLDLSSGKLRVLNNLELISNTTVSGSESEYIITYPGAYVNYTPGTGMTLLPVGTENYYTPVEINSSSGMFSVNVEDTVYSDGDYGIPLIDNNVNIRWNILAGSDYDLTLYWDSDAGNDNFDNDNSYISWFDGSSWDNPGATAGSEVNGLLTQSRNGIDNNGFFSVFSDNNTPPTALNSEIVMLQNSVYAFVPEDFSYSDSDGNPFAKIKITQEPTKGQLFLDINDNDVADPEDLVLNQISITDISNGLLKYIPVTDEFGMPYTDFSYQVSDGQNYSNDTAVMTIDVSNNQAPVADAEQIFTIPEHSPQGTVVGRINASDPDGDNIYFYPSENVAYSDAFKLADDGTITVNNSGLLEYSLNPSFEYNLDVCDDGLPELCTPVKVIINLEEVIRNLIPANFISPNGDGHNDRWLVQGLENDTYEAFIFNNNGKLLFYSPDYKNGWDGTSKGSELPPGVYYYLLKSPSTEVKGTITLVR